MQSYSILLSLFSQGLLKKHEAFETDLEVHRERVQDIEDGGSQLIEKVNLFNSVKTKFGEKVHVLVTLINKCIPSG